MYGGGNIGRGFIAQLFCLSGWETVFVDVNTALVDDMNTRHEYPIFITGAEDYERFTVTNVRAAAIPMRWRKRLRPPISWRLPSAQIF